ncbi:hypothetical protein [Nonlabens sp. MB-3u-79]|uniref:hypothetical protein n=1 Tax=Nonlabens sp. MB-3u-79 TaxID=2058134 RepID=UPI0012FDAD6C|nr:hypothetical protein [Nonlabens sp. MB-3u-79]|tara:strand:+ start:1681 stop:2112 length:432 start_codon:yes stop_codon:yes gene_type:complete
MKKIVSIIILLVFGMSFGQNKNENDVEELDVKTFRWITENCSDLNNPYENDLCIKNEINKFINKNLKWSITENLPNGNYEVRIYLTIEKDGKIFKIIAKSDYEELNNELKNTLMLFQNRIKFVDENKNAYKNTLSFPITINVG